MAALGPRRPSVPAPAVGSRLNALSLAIFVALTALYVGTLCPTVYWGDSAEYIITSFTLRNAHPSGYPLYSLVGKAASLLPLGSVAFRINLLSAVLGAGTIALSFRLMTRLGGDVTVALAAAVTLGLSRTFWNLSTIAESLTLNLFLVTLLLLLVLTEDGTPPKWTAAAFLAGLACSNHLQSLLALPAAALLFAARNPRWKLAAPRLPALALFFVAGLSVYAYLPLRSGYPYPNIYADADTLDGFFTYYLGRSPYLGPERLRGWGEALGLLPQVVASVPRELGWPLTLFCFPGLFALWRRSRAAAAAVLSVALLAVLSAVFNGPAGTTYKMFLYSAQAYWALALLGCCGGAWLVRRLAATAAARLAIVAVPAVFLAGAALLLRPNLRYNDLSSQDWASRYAEEQLASLPPGSVYLPGKDNPINLTMYWRFIKGYRPDVALIPQEGLMSGFYHRRVRNLYPDLAVGDYDAVEERLGAGSLADYGLVASYFGDLAARNPGREVFVHPDIPEEYLVMPREPWGGNYRILHPSASGAHGTPAAGWDAFEMDLAHRAPPFLFDDFVIPDLADIRQRFGWFYLQRGEPERAIAEYRRSVELLPGSPGLRFNLARTLHAVGNFDDAARELGLVLEREPKHAPAGLLLARVKLAAGDAGGAVRLLETYREQTVDAAPGNTDHLVLYGRALYAVRRFEDLAAVGRRLVEAGESFDGWYAQGMALAATNRLPEAEAAYREALRVRPDDFRVLNNLGVVLMQQGKTQEAADAFRRALAVNPGYEPARRNLAGLP